MRLGIGIEVLILEKSTRSRIAPTAKFCILHSYGRTARDLRQKTKKAIRSRPRPPTEEQSAESFDTDDGASSLLRNSLATGPHSLTLVLPTSRAPLLRLGRG